MVCPSALSQVVVYSEGEGCGGYIKVVRVGYAWHFGPTLVSSWMWKRQILLQNLKGIWWARGQNIKAAQEI